MSRHVALTAIAALVALLVAPSIGLSLWIAAGIVVLVSFLAYALSDPPPRYRRHGWVKSSRPLTITSAGSDGTIQKIAADSIRAVCPGVTIHARAAAVESTSSAAAGPSRCLEVRRGKQK